MALTQRLAKHRNGLSEQTDDRENREDPRDIERTLPWSELENDRVATDSDES